MFTPVYNVSHKTARLQQSMNKRSTVVTRRGVMSWSGQKGVTAELEANGLERVLLLMRAMLLQKSL